MRYPAELRREMNTKAGVTLRKAKRTGDACAVSKAMFPMQQSVLAKVDGSEFHHWQQFHNQRFEREQESLDHASGLTNTGEMSNAYFTSGSAFLCWKFTDYQRLTMPVLVVAGKFDGAVDPVQQRALAERLQHAVYDEFENSAHFPLCRGAYKIQQGYREISDWKISHFRCK